MTRKKKPLILITGAAAGVGRKTAEAALAQERYAVAAIDPTSPSLKALEASGAQIRTGDFGDPDDCKKLVEGVSAIIYATDTFDLSKPQKAILEGNCHGAENLIRAAGDAGVSHFLLLSSAEVYASELPIPIDENQRLAPESDYGIAKLRLEQVARTRGAECKMPVTILRPAMIYGPGAIHFPSVLYALPYLIKSLVGFSAKPVGGPLINCVHIDDVAGALLYLCNNPAAFNQTFNVADNDWLRLGELIERAWEPMGMRWSFKLPLFKLPLKLAAWAGEVMIPDVAFDLANGLVQGQWRRLNDQRGFSPGFVPRIDRGLLHYTTCDWVYDNSRLTRLGYQLAVPGIDRGLAQTIEHYVQINRLPRN